MSELIGSRVQVPIAQTLAAQCDGHCIGRPFDLGFEKLMSATVVLVFSTRVVPLEQLASFGLGQEWQIGDARRWIDNDAFQQSAQVLGHASNSVSVEEVGVVFKRSLKLRAQLVEVERQRSEEHT